EIVVPAKLPSTIERERYMLGDLFAHVVAVRRSVPCDRLKGHSQTAWPLVGLGQACDQEHVHAFMPGMTDTGETRPERVQNERLAGPVQAIQDRHRRI